MIRLAPTLFALAFLAGCINPAADVEEASAAFDPIPAALKAEGATIEAIPGGVRLAWTGTVTQARGDLLGVGTLLGGPFAPQVADLALTLPTEVRLLHGWVNWSQPGVGLTFRMRNEDGVSMCGGVMPDGGTAECFATLYAERDAPEDWTARVTAIGTAMDPKPVEFAFTLLLGTDPLPILGFPAAAGEEARMRFGAPVLLSDDKTHTAEPSIAVTPKGTIYVAAPVSAQRALWRSTDGGASFEEIAIHGQPTDPGSQYPNGGGDSDVAVSGEDAIYFADQHTAETVSSSRDGGRTWFTQPLGSGAPLTDRQWLVTDGPLGAWLAYNGVRGAMIARTLDGGRSWHALGNVPEDDCFRGNLARAPDGTLYLAGCNSEGPGVGVSTDGGLSWTWRKVADRSGDTNTSFIFPAHLFVVATTDADGNVYVVWSDEAQRSEDTGAPEGPHGLNIWLASSTDQGASWSKPKRVNAAEGTYVLPWATAGAPGKVAVAYYGTKFVGHPERVLGEWYPILAVSEDVLADDAVFHEAVASTEVVQYGPICMRGSACGNARNLLDFFQIQADRDGLVHMAYVDGREGGNYRYANIMYLRQTGGLGVGARSVDKDGGALGIDINPTSYAPPTAWIRS